MLWPSCPSGQLLSPTWGPGPRSPSQQHLSRHLPHEPSPSLPINLSSHTQTPRSSTLLALGKYTQPHVWDPSQIVNNLHDPTLPLLHATTINSSPKDLTPEISLILPSAHPSSSFHLNYSCFLTNHLASTLSWLQSPRHIISLLAFGSP